MLPSRVQLPLSLTALRSQLTASAAVEKELLLIVCINLYCPWRQPLYGQPFHSKNQDFELIKRFACQIQRVHRVWAEGANLFNAGSKQGVTLGNCLLSR